MVNVATWNINIVAADKHPNTLIYPRIQRLRDENPGLNTLFLQEVPDPRGYKEDFWDHPVFDGMTGVFATQKFNVPHPLEPRGNRIGIYGTAILTTYPMESTVLTLPMISWFKDYPSQLNLETAIVGEVNGVKLVNAHLGHFAHPDGRLNQINAILRAIGDAPAILGGDINLFRRIIMDSQEPGLAALHNAGFTDPLANDRHWKYIFDYFADYIMHRGVDVLSASLQRDTHEDGHPIIHGEFSIKN